MSRSFLQTTEWLEFQSFIGRKTFSYNNGKIKANIIQHDLPFGKNYLYIPHGPEISLGEIQSGLKNEVDNFLKYLKNLGKENKSIFVKMEPMEDVVMEVIYRKNIKHSKKSIQPTKTVVIDLNFPEAKLLEKRRDTISMLEKKGGFSYTRETIWTLSGSCSNIRPKMIIFRLMTKVIMANY